MVKWLLLVRHAESTKNLEGRFASDDEDETLTVAGERCAEELGREIAGLVEQLGITSVSVVSGTSFRSRATALNIGGRLGLGVRTIDRLRSIRIDSIVGKAEAELLHEGNPFMQQLLLYRAGVLNSYDLPGMRAISREFESEQLKIIEAELLTLPDGGMCVIVAHRSPITAILIGIARLGHSYPDYFYGFIPLELGYCSLVRVTNSLTADTPPKILAVNRPCRELLQVLTRDDA